MARPCSSEVFISNRSIRTFALALALATLLAGCGDDPGDRAAERRAASPASPSPAAEGDPSPAPEGDCVNGWEDPQDPERRELPFHVLRRTLDLDGDFRVFEMRYFEGPEAPPLDKGYALVVKRWYVKAASMTDRRMRARFLVEERTFGSGLAAVAPFESEGFRSPDWVGFQYEGRRARPRAYPGLPGRWAGTPYDFVTGEPAFNFPGLPEEVVGCLEGT